LQSSDIKKDDDDGKEKLKNWEERFNLTTKEDYQKIYKFMALRAHSAEEQVVLLQNERASDFVTIKALAKSARHTLANTMRILQSIRQNEADILAIPGRDKRGFSATIVKYMLIALMFGSVVYVLQANPRYLQLFELYMTQYGLHIIASIVLLTGLSIYLIVRRRRKPSE